jgi:hypothetical protein
MTGFTESYIRLLCGQGGLTASRHSVATLDSRYRWLIEDDSKLVARTRRNSKQLGTGDRQDRPAKAVDEAPSPIGRVARDVDAAMSALRDDARSARTAALQEKGVADAALEAASAQSRALEELRLSNQLLIEAAAAAQRAGTLEGRAAGKLAEALRLRGDTLTDLLVPGSPGELHLRVTQPPIE